MRVMALDIEVEDGEFIDEVFPEQNNGFDKYVARVVNSKLHEMKSMRRDMDLFRKYLKEHPRNKYPLWFYGYKLRKAHGWTHSHLLEVEDNILGSKANNGD